MNEARILIGFEKCVEFQLIPDRIDPEFQEPTREEIIGRYVPDPWRSELLFFLTIMAFSNSPGDKESWDVFWNIKNELRNRKLILN